MKATRRQACQTALTVLVLLGSSSAVARSNSTVMKRRKQHVGGGAHQERSSQKAWTEGIVLDKIRPDYRAQLLELPVQEALNRTSSRELRNPRIINGRPADIGEYPYYSTVWASRFICGAALVAPDILVTAAHCDSAFKDQALVGAYIPDKRQHGAVVVQVLKQVPHPQYNDNTLKHDIMILKIGPPVNNKKLIKINLDHATPRNNAKLMSIGMGATSDGNTYPDELEEIEVTRVSDSECSKEWGNIGDRILCAWSPQPFRAICGGDSGGPLIDRNSDEDLLVGVVSFGRQSCLARSPPGYTRVTAYETWLKQEICDRSDNPPANLNCPGSSNPPPPTASPPTASPPTCVATGATCNGDGSFYRGCVAQTKDGLTCQPWSDQSPNPHDYSPSKYPNAGLQGNYCRNPDNDSEGPWCVTTDPVNWWGHCDIPECNGGTAPVAAPVASPTPPASCEAFPATCSNPRGKDYRGCKSVTRNGRTCQAWTSQFPHKHDRTPQNYPNTGIDSGNFCRNPDNDVNGPWCYTTESSERWEYCDVEECQDGFVPPTPPAVAPVAPPTANKNCVSPSTCNPAINGKDYRGCVSQTSGGKACARWDAQPDRHWTPENAPNHGLAENYCRNPDNDPDGNWCYTARDGSWGHCDIPECNRQTPPAAAPVVGPPTGGAFCQAPGQSCSSNSDCCSSVFKCTGSSPSSLSCKMCAMTMQICESTVDCCGANKMARCDFGICAKCAGKNKMCRFASDCCTRGAMCVFKNMFSFAMKCNR